MRTVRCIVCGKDIGLYGWASHVSKEKRLHGDDIYIRLRQGDTITRPLERYLEEE